MGKVSFPIGFRFSPSDVELVQYYLKRKTMGKKLRVNFIAEVDIHKYAPWDLPDKSCWQGGDLKWYFFCPTARKRYSSAARVQRATECGYWKATGKDRSVPYNGQVAGWIKTLIFYTGRAPKGERTDWVMHEYRLEAKDLADSGVPYDSYVLCMIFQKDGPGPRIGAQYGAPIKDEDSTDDETEICSEAVSHANMPEPNIVPPSNYNSSITSIGPSSESCLSDVLPTSCNVPQPVSSNHVTMKKRHVSNDDVQTMLNCFTEGSTSLMKEKRQNDVFDELGNVIYSGNASAELGNVIPLIRCGNASAELGNVICSGNTSAQFGNVINFVHASVQPGNIICSRNASPQLGNVICSGNASVELGNAINTGNTIAERSSGIHSGTASEDLGNVIHSGTASEELGNAIHSGNANEELGNVIHTGNASAELGNVIHTGNASAAPNFNAGDIYEDLGDLDNMARISEDGYNLSIVHNPMDASGQRLLSGDENFLELDDLDLETPFRSDYHLNVFDKPNF